MCDKISFHDGLGTVTTRKNLRVSFRKCEERETECYIKDLEDSIQINKGIIRDLCENFSNKSALSLLNEENRQLHLKISELKRRIKEADAKELVFKQIIEEYKRLDTEHEKEYKERFDDLKEQLSRKELYMQIMEKKFNDAVDFIRRNLLYHSEVQQFLQNSQGVANEHIGVCNIVKQNETLREENRNLKEEAIELKNKIISLEGLMKGCQEDKIEIEDKASEATIELTSIENEERENISWPLDYLTENELIRKVSKTL